MLMQAQGWGDGTPGYGWPSTRQHLGSPFPGSCFPWDAAAGLAGLFSQSKAEWGISTSSSFAQNPWGAFLARFCWIESVMFWGVSWSSCLCLPGSAVGAAHSLLAEGHPGLFQAQDRNAAPPLTPQAQPKGAGPLALFPKQP